jgi:hypothetical protein
VAVEAAAEPAVVVETPAEAAPVVVAEAVPEPAAVVETPAQPEPVVAVAVETPVPEPEPVVVASTPAPTPVIEVPAAEPEPVLVAAAVATAGPVTAAAPAHSNGHTNGHGNHHVNLQANLWEAAKIVAEAATAPAAVIEPAPAPIPIQLAAAPAVQTIAQPMMVNGSAARAGLVPAVPPLPVAKPQVADESTNYNIPAFIASSRKGMDGAKWVIFGSTAAFLGIVWAAIWFTVGK